ncbi:MAG: hypothetical protein ACOX43_08580 [Bacilli bacterium]
MCAFLGASNGYRTCISALGSRHNNRYRATSKESSFDLIILNDVQNIKKFIVN